MPKRENNANNDVNENNEINEIVNDEILDEDDIVNFRFDEPDVIDGQGNVNNNEKDQNEEELIDDDMVNFRFDEPDIAVEQKNVNINKINEKIAADKMRNFRFDEPMNFDEPEQIQEENIEAPEERKYDLKADFVELKKTTLDSIKEKGTEMFSDEGLFIDEKGHPYKSDKELSNALLDPNNAGKNFFFFLTEEDNPYCVRVENGKVMMSKGMIGVDNQLGDQPFEPKPSLKITDIVQSKNLDSEKNQIKDKLSEVHKIAKNPDAYIKKFTDAEKQFQENGYEETRRRTAILRSADEKTFGVEPKKPVKPKVPKKPTFGVGSSIWRGFVKVFSFGQAETKAYKDYLRKMEQYNKAMKDYKDKALPAYKVETDYYKDVYAVYTDQKKIVDDEYNKEVQALHQKTEDAVARTQNIKDEKIRLKERLDDLDDNMTMMDAETTRDLRNYQNNIEVRVEGIADIRRTGKISDENIFANTWLKGEALRGKKYSELTDEDKNTLAGYVASKLAEDKIVKAALGNKNYYQAETSSLIAGLNNGSAVEAVRNSEVFNEILKMKSEDNMKVTPETFANNYRDMLLSSRRDLNDPIKKLKNERDGMVEKFGTKRVGGLGEKDFVEFARYMSVTAEIKRLEDKRNKGQPITNEDRGHAMQYVQDLHLNPNAKIKGEKSLTNWSGMHKQEMVADVRDYMSKSYKAAFDTVVNSNKYKYVGLNELADKVVVAKDPSLAPKNAGPKPAPKAL